MSDSLFSSNFLTKNFQKVSLPLLCWVVSTCPSTKLFSFVRLLWPPRSWLFLHHCITQAPWSTSFWLGWASGRYWQEMRGTKRKNGVFFIPLPPCLEAVLTAAAAVSLEILSWDPLLQLPQGSNNTFHLLPHDGWLYVSTWLGHRILKHLVKHHFLVQLWECL